MSHLGEANCFLKDQTVNQLDFNKTIKKKKKDKTVNNFGLVDHMISVASTQYGRLKAKIIHEKAHTEKLQSLPTPDLAF